jgi:hypothetical protein
MEGSTRPWERGAFDTYQLRSPFPLSSCRGSVLSAHFRLNGTIVPDVSSLTPIRVERPTRQKTLREKIEQRIAR